MPEFIRIHSPQAVTPKYHAAGPMDVNLDNVCWSIPVNEEDGAPPEIVCQFIFMNGIRLDVTKLPEEWKKFGRKD